MIPTGLGQAQERYQFTFPELYLHFLQLGCFDPFHERYLQLADLLWLPPAQIARHRFHRQQIDGLIPFARTAQEDLWCFYPAIDEGTGQAVVFCPDEDEVASIYAPDFEAFVYRAMLEEYACTGLTEHYEVNQAPEVLRGFTAFLQSWLKPAWAHRLQEVDRLPWQRDANGYYGAIDVEILNAILAADLAYDRLDEEFEHFIDDED